MGSETPVSIATLVRTQFPHDNMGVWCILVRLYGEFHCMWNFGINFYRKMLQMVWINKLINKVIKTFKNHTRKKVLSYNTLIEIYLHYELVFTLKVLPELLSWTKIVLSKWIIFTLSSYSKLKRLKFALSTFSCLLIEHCNSATQCISLIMFTKIMSSVINLKINVTWPFWDLSGMGWGISNSALWELETNLQGPYCKHFYISIIVYVPNTQLRIENSLASPKFS